MFARGGALQSIRVPSKPMMRALRLQMGPPTLFNCKWGGVAPPPPPSDPPLLSKPGKLASKHTSPFQTHAVSYAFANGGGGAAPPPTRTPCCCRLRCCSSQAPPFLPSFLHLSLKVLGWREGLKCFPTPHQQTGCHLNLLPHHRSK